ncbi:MAG: helix-turn-helix transcriptional regulator [Clostridia bacterium]|nr:helix-turn-helix transcriptional regulator [Clostridia bacterium]
MKIVRAGYNFCHSETFAIHRPAGSGDYLLLIIKSGAFVLQNGERRVLPHGGVLLYKKGTPQHYGAAGGRFVNDWVHFEIEDGQVIADLGICFDVPLLLPDTAELSEVVHSIVLERHTKSRRSAEVSACYLQLLLYKIAEKIEGQTAAREHLLYPSFCALRGEIRAEPQKQWKIDEICKNMMISRSYLQHLYKQFFGRSVTEEIRRGRMEYARYLLTATDMPVREIAHTCGYESDVHFMRLFKENVGVTPTAYRKRTV